MVLLIMNRRMNYLKYRRKMLSLYLVPEGTGCASINSFFSYVFRLDMVRLQSWYLRFITWEKHNESDYSRNTLIYNHFLLLFYFQSFSSVNLFEPRKTVWCAMLPEKWFKKLVRESFFQTNVVAYVLVIFIYFQC